MGLKILFDKHGLGRILTSLLILLLLLSLIPPSLRFKGVDVSIPLGQITDENNRAYTLNWVKHLDLQNNKTIVDIMFMGKGERHSDTVLAVTSLPQVFVVRMSDGTVLYTYEFTPPLMGITVGPEKYTSVSGNGRYTVILFYDRVKDKYGIHIYDNIRGVAATIPLDYRAKPEPSIVRITYSGRYILVGDRKGFLACYYRSGTLPGEGGAGGGSSPSEPFVLESHSSPFGIYVAAGGETGNQAYIYSFNGTKLVNLLAGGKKTSMVFSGDGKYLVVGSRDDKIYYFLTKGNGSPKWKYESDGHDILTVDISYNGSNVVAGDSKGRILYWSRAETLSGNNPQPDWVYATIQNREIYSVSISNDGARVAAGGRNGRIYLLNSSGGLVWNNPYRTGGPVRSVAISKDGRFLAAGGDDKWVYFFGDSSNNPLWRYRTGNRIDTVAISYFGRYVAAGSGSRIYFFDAWNGQLLWIFKGDGRIYSAALSYSGRYLAAAGGDGWIYYFDTRSSRPLWSWKASGKINDVAMSFDGNIVVAGGEDDRLYYWFGAKDMLGGETRSRDEGHGPTWIAHLDGKVKAVTVTPVYGPKASINQSVLESVVIASDTSIVYVDSYNRIYTGRLALIIDNDAKKIWDLDQRSFFPKPYSGSIRENSSITLLFTYPGENYGLGENYLPSEVYKVYLIVKGVAYDGYAFAQRIEAGTVSIDRPSTYSPSSGGTLGDTVTVSGSYRNLEKKDSDYWILRSYTIITTTPYNPSDYILKGRTKHVSGSINDLKSNNSIYMTFKSYQNISYPDLIINGKTVTLSGTHYYRNVKIINRGVLRVKDYDGSTGGNLTIIAMGDIYIDSTSKIIADGAGYRGGKGNPGIRYSNTQPGSPGEGPGGGGGGSHEGLRLGGTGGGGGGYGGIGGAGGAAYNGTPIPGDGGGAYGDKTSLRVMMGSGGGGGEAGGYKGNGDKGGDGGDGGGAIILRADGTITVNGLISANGENGGQGYGWRWRKWAWYSGGGGGGGSGGGILLYAKRIIISGRVRAEGGDGGSHDPLEGAWGFGGGGGGGSGGRIKIIGETVSIRGRVSVAGGSGGKGARTYSGKDGSDGTIYIKRQTYIPYFPSTVQIVEVEFTGKSNTANWTSLKWTVDSALTQNAVNVTLQLYNYKKGEYSTSGDGYIFYTSSRANVDETKSQTITVNPQRFRDDDGEWKLRIKAVKKTNQPFNLKVDWIEFKVTYKSRYAADWYAQFKVSEKSSDVTKMRITYYGYYNVSNVLQSMYIWDYSKSQWIQLGSTDLYRDADTGQYQIRTVTSNISSYISQDGYVKVRIKGVNINQPFKVYADYLRLEVYTD